MNTNWPAPWSPTNARKQPGLTYPCKSLNRTCWGPGIVQVENTAVNMDWSEIQVLTAAHLTWFTTSWTLWARC